MTQPTVEILTIGSEVLADDVLDTNSHWLCQQLASRGAPVVRITTLPDDPSGIGETLLAAAEADLRQALAAVGIQVIPYPRIYANRHE